MSKVSIFEKKWLDIVFENKNKEYGAYQLRRESPKTTLLAFASGLGLVVLLSGITFFVSAFGVAKPSKPKPILTDSIRVFHVELNPEVVPPPPPPLLPGETSQRHTPNPIPVPTPTPLVDPEPAPNPEPISGPSQPSGGSSASEGGSTSGLGNNTNSTPTPTPEVSYKPLSANLLDEQPQYPGGIKKFYNYIAQHFEDLNIEDRDQITVTLSFVIEKDGTLTDIKVLQNPGFGIDQEAIRVLQSDKSKWKPGKKNGENVPSRYTLPITVKLNPE